MNSIDVVVVGAGMAGASAAYEISATRSVVLLEREAQPGYHATGRSAALFSETYGNATIRGLTAASRMFYREPPPGFASVPLLTPRGVIMVARADQMPRLEAWSDGARRIVPDVRMLDADAVLAAVPLLRPGYVAGGAIEPGAMDLDVDAIQQGFLRGARARGATLVPGAELLGLAVGRDGWTVTTATGEWHARTVVNAAGAWADEVAVMAGAQPCGLQSMRRTAFIVDLPPGMNATRWPMVIDTDEAFYFKPEGGRLLLSPADETPMPPCDVQPDEMDVAVAVDRVQQAADLPVRRVVRSWAGLRSFTADRTPVVGFDQGVPGLFWLAGQGGYGIQTAPAMGRLAAALLAGEGVPQDMRSLGVGAASLAPGRSGLHDASSHAGADE